MQNFAAAITSLQTYRIYAPNQEQETLRKHIDQLRQKQRKQKEHEEQKKRQQEEQQKLIASQPTNPPPKKPSPSPLLGVWGGMTGAGLLGGTIFALQARRARKELEGLCQGSLCPNTAQDMLQKDKRSALGADISWSIAAIGLVGGTVTILRSQKLHIGPNYLQWNGKF